MVPKAPEYIWLSNFLLWNFIFTLVPVLEYAILNAADVSFKKRRQAIQELHEELVALAQRSQQPELAEQVLNESRKLISRRFRQKVVGGDFL